VRSGKEQHNRVTFSFLSLCFVFQQRVSFNSSLRFFSASVYFSERDKAGNQIKAEKIRVRAEYISSADKNILSVNVMVIHASL